MNVHQIWTCVAVVLLLGLLSAAVWHDVRTRRIPNRLVFSGAMLGLVLNALPLRDELVLAPLAAPAGLLMALAGLGLGLALLMPMYMMKAMGAGDVKMMAMIGAFLGPQAVFSAALLTMLAGGVLALSVAMWNGSLSKVMRNTYHMLLHSWARSAGGALPSIDAPPTPTGKLPYAIAIASGTVIYLVLYATGHLGIFA